MESVELVARPAVSAQVCQTRVPELLFVKRVFDIVLASTALLCALPVLLVCSIAIMLESAGSPLFVQARVGQDGKLFRIFKLRSMHPKTERFGFRTIAGDKRLTRIGALLRRLNVDELPQLINVLIGDMSIIGPRPLSVQETDFLISQDEFSKDYPGLIPKFRPGLIGLEQMNRNRDLTYSERFSYNYLYESTWTPLSDLKIFGRAVYLCSPACVAVATGALLLICIALIH